MSLMMILKMFILITQIIDQNKGELEINWFLVFSAVNLV